MMRKAFILRLSERLRFAISIVCFRSISPFFYEGVTLLLLAY